MKLKLNYERMSVLPYSQRRDLPSEPGIYYVGNYSCPVCYVGRTDNLKRRHESHHRRVQFEEMEYAVIRYRTLPNEMLRGITNLYEILCKLERQAIDNYQPPLNRTPVPEQLPLNRPPVPSQLISILCGTGFLIRSR